MRFTIAPYCAAISPAACVPAMPSACTVLSASSFKPRAAPAPAEKTPSVAAAHAAELSDGHERRQHHRAHVQHAFAVHVVQLEPLDLRAVCERRVRRREPLRRPPNAATAGAVQFLESALQDPAPFEMRAVERAAERIEDEELRALAHFARNRFVAEPGNEFGDAARIGVGDLAHSRRIFASRINLPRRSFSARMWEANRSGVPPI